VWKPDLQFGFERQGEIRSMPDVWFIWAAVSLILCFACAGQLIYWLVTGACIWSIEVQSQAFIIFPPLIFFPIACMPCGIIHMDKEVVSFRNFLCDDEMRWDEVQKVSYSGEHNHGCWVQCWVVLEGKDKRLSIPGPCCWSGSGVARARSDFYSQILSRSIPTIRLEGIDLWVLSKGVRRNSAFEDL